jgi:hypothetical protein
MMLTRQNVAARAATRATSCVRPAAVSRVARVAVRAEATAEQAPKAAEKPAWTEPTLNPDTPSPIFGGSTGGLLRKAQVPGRAGAVFTHCGMAALSSSDDRALGDARSSSDASYRFKHKFSFPGSGSG